MNGLSSRSHCVITLQITCSGPDGAVTAGKLRMVDLAGSERAARTKTEGQVLAEGSLINLSLSTLGLVVNGLTDTNPKAHIPYRSSKLTRLLRDVLGPDSHTVLVLCVSAAAMDAQETLSTLRFGARAKHIPACPTRHVVGHPVTQPTLHTDPWDRQERDSASPPHTPTNRIPGSSSRGALQRGPVLRQVATALAGVTALQLCAACLFFQYWPRLGHECAR